MREKIRELAEQAGREILKIYRSGDWTVTEKADESPVTQADLVANAIIVEGLARLTQEPIVSEESDPQSVKVGRHFWLIDPLDGTRDFIHKKDSFVVCIARIEDGYPVFGLIHSPTSGETWWAEKNHGSFRALGASERRLQLNRQNQRVQTELIALGSRSMASQRMQGFYDHFAIGDVRRLGSALKFCRLAEGEADLYPRFGPTSEWDTAAGQLILEEAGGKVIDISTGERLKYAKPAFLNSGGFFASRADLDIYEKLAASGLLKR